MMSLGVQVQQALLHSKEVLLHQLLVKDRALKKRSFHCWISARQAPHVPWPASIAVLVILVILEACKTAGVGARHHQHSLTSIIVCKHGSK